MIYLDYNATTPIDNRVANAMLPYLFDHFGNPSSGHEFGIKASGGVDKARSQVASMLGCSQDEVIFTSGGTESNNLALIGAALANRERGNHIITSAVEHPAVLMVCEYLKTVGFDITILPVDIKGGVSPGNFKEAITQKTILASIMHANNEVGTIQPIKALSETAHRHNIIFHSDAAQSIGKIPVRVEALGVDLLSIAGHKLYTPKGVGALYIRYGTKIHKTIHGADQERSFRPGTENVLGIVGLGEGCKLIEEQIFDFKHHFKEMRDLLEEQILTAYSWVKINGDQDNRLPNTSSMSFQGIDANKILLELKNVAASAGAACHADRVEISHVLEAMNVPREVARGTIRISTGRMTTEKEIRMAAGEIIKVIELFMKDERE